MFILYHYVKVILDPKIVARKYLKSWFVVDLGSSFPFDYCIVLVSQGRVSSSLLKASRVLRVVRLAKLLSLLKLLRISRLLRFMTRWEEVSENNSFNFLLQSFSLFDLCM